MAMSSSMRRASSSGLTKSRTSKSSSVGTWASMIAPRCVGCARIENVAEENLARILATGFFHSIADVGDLVGRARQGSYNFLLYRFDQGLRLSQYAPGYPFTDRRGRVVRFFSDLQCVPQGSSEKDRIQLPTVNQQTVELALDKLMTPFAPWIRRPYPSKEKRPRQQLENRRSKIDLHKNYTDDQQNPLLPRPDSPPP